MKRLVIDVDSVVPYFVSGKYSGIGRTTLELVNAMSQIEDIPFQILLYSQNFKGVGGENLKTKFKCKHLYLRNKDNWNKIIGKLPIREWFTNYDLIHYPHNFEYTYNPQKCILTIHDAMFMRIKDRSAGTDNLVDLLPPLARQVKHIFTCSECSKQDIVNMMGVKPENVSVVYWGINHEQFFVQEDKYAVRKKLKEKFGIDKPYFFSVSCNPSRKRIDKLLYSYIELSKRYPINTDIVLAWGNTPSHVLQMINECGHIQEHIKILPYISDEDLALLYNGAKAMIFPSEYEGFGLPLIEAMACGCPVVTCKNSSLSEIAGNCGVYINEPVEQNFDDILVALDEDKIDLKGKINYGVEYAKTFTWKRAANQYIEVYKKLLL